MILDILDKKNEIMLTQFKKTIGIYLVSKYFPELCKHKQAYLISSIDEWKKIEHKFKDRVTMRTDSRLGQDWPKMRGRTGHKNDAIKYMKEAIKKEKEPYFICMELEEGSGERVNTNGAFLLNLNMGGNVTIKYVGPCFDYGDLVRMKAEHESWVISWNNIPEFDPMKIDDYHVKTIKQEKYRKTAIDRMTFLITDYPHRKEDVIRKMPRTYTEIDKGLIKKLYKEVLYPLYQKKEQLLEDELMQLEAEFNILENNEFVPMELCRPKSYAFKAKISNEIEDRDVY